MMDVDSYLQVISIFVAIVAVALPILITMLAFVYVKRVEEKIDNLSSDVDTLWDRLEGIHDSPKNNELQV